MIRCSTTIWSTRGLATWGLVVVAFLCFAIWWLSPIYPDEIAFRQHFGRIGVDGGVLRGLYDLCESNVKTVPAVLRPVAYALAEIMQALSPLAMRVLSFAAVMGVIFTTACLVGRERNPWAGFIALASFVGVAGSSLIFVRYEFVLEVHLLSCLIAAYFLRRPVMSAVLDVAMALGLLGCAALSIYGHIQGLLLLPLTAYLLQGVAVRRFGHRGGGAAIIPFLLLVPPALGLHRSTCSEFPEIERYWKQMVFDPSTFSITDTRQWLLNNWRAYEGSFVYTDQFTLGYLPSVEASGLFLEVLNFAIAAVVALVAGLAALSPVVVVILWFRRKIRLPFAGFGTTKETSTSPVFIAMLLLCPMIFLYMYDMAHAFYRNIYVNHCAAIALALAASEISTTALTKGVKIFSAAITAVAVLSMAYTSTAILPKLYQGYHGPSISALHDWSQSQRDIEALAHQCGANLDLGRILVDDLTQPAVFSKHMIFPITYIHMQALISNITLTEAIEILHPNYALLTCNDLTLLGVKPQVINDSLCCFNFLARGN